MNPALKAWLRQPTTVHGIGAIVGTVSAVVAYYATHDAKTAAVVFGSAFGVVCMAMGDNSADKSSVEQLATDAVQAIVSQRIGAMLPTLSTDVVRVLTPVPSPAAAPAPATPAP